METVRILIALSGMTVVGYSMLSLIFFGRTRELSWADKIALSYGLGVGFFSIEMLAFFLIGRAFSIAALAAPALVLVALGAVLRARAGFAGRREDITPMKNGISSNRHLRIFLVSAIAVVIIYTGFRTMIKPIESYDAVAIHSLKSKIFFMNRSIPSDFFAGIGRTVIPHPDYPLNVPLIETFLYMCVGSLNDQLVKVVFLLFFLSTLTILYCGIRRFAGANYALLFTFLLASIPQFNSFAANAYLEMPLAYYCFASALYLILWIEDSSRTSCLVLSAVLSGLAGWTKNEGLLYCVIYAVVVSAYLAANRRRGGMTKILLLPSAYLAIAAVICAPWFFVKWRYGLTNSDISISSSSGIFGIFKNLWKVGPIVYDFQKQVFGPKKWNIIWILVFAAFALRFKRAFGPVMRYVTASIMAAIAGYFAVYVLTHVDVRFLLRTTWSRFILHFLPLLVYWLARMWREDLEL